MSENRYEKDSLGLSGAEKMREYGAVTEWGIDNLLERKRYLMHSFTARILATLETRKRNSNICPAGSSLLSVSTQGDISPCWMYTDEAPFDMGHVDDAELLGPKARQVTELLSRNELHSHPECQRCVIQPLCFGCKGGDYHATGSPSGKNNCDYMRAMVVTAMMRLHSRPDLPAQPAGYYLRPSFGEREHLRLRPAVQVKHEILAHPIKVFRPGREAIHAQR
jgi:radical SAM protein with 4Fe4S-binding SPASM domain